MSTVVVSVNKGRERYAMTKRESTGPSGGAWTQDAVIQSAEAQGKGGQKLVTLRLRAIHGIHASAILDAQAPCTVPGLCVGRLDGDTHGCVLGGLWNPQRFLACASNLQPLLEAPGPRPSTSASHMVDEPPC